MAVTFTQTQVDTFKAALLLNPGLSSIQFGDQVYQFESLEKRTEFLSYMMRNIDTGSAGRVRFAATSKGV